MNGKAGDRRALTSAGLAVGGTPVEVPRVEMCQPHAATPRTPGAAHPVASGAAVRYRENCGAPAPRAYCADCGQEQHSYHRSVRALVAELLDALAG